MRATDLPEFMEILACMGEIHDKLISKQLTDIYWETLQTFELVDVKQAFQRHIRNPDGGQFFPKPADIVRLIEGSGETRALSAWAKVEKAMVQVGIYQSVVFDDFLIHAVLEEMGGWMRVCGVKFGELPFLAREFQKRYMGFVNRPPQRYPKYCCGLAEADNAKNNFPIPPRLLIGEAKKAEQVLLTGGSNALPVCVHADEILQQWVEQLSRPELKTLSHVQP